MRSIPWIAIALLATYVACTRDPLGSAPKTIIWAWERPEDLRFANPADVGVAFLAATATLTGDDVRIDRRRQPLMLPQGKPYLMAVYRVEARGATLSPRQREELATRIAKLADEHFLRAVQIDFDALRSQRDFYRAFLQDLRPRLRNHQQLSITALASWCFDDSAWLENLPVDEAVPMLFQMGSDDRDIRRRLDNGADFKAKLCRSSLGISTNEPLPRLPRARRVYVFHPKPWNPEALGSILTRIPQ